MKRLYLALGGAILLFASYTTYNLYSSYINPRLELWRAGLTTAKESDSTDAKKYYINFLNEFAYKHRNSPPAYKAALDAMLRTALREMEEKRSKEGYPNLKDPPNFNLG